LEEPVGEATPATGVDTVVPVAIREVETTVEEAGQFVTSLEQLVIVAS
jgi:hypothetical protein